MRNVRPFFREEWISLFVVVASLVWASSSYCQSCYTENAGCIGGKIKVRKDPNKCGAPKSDTLDDDAPNTVLVTVTVRGSGKTKRFPFNSGQYQFPVDVADWTVYATKYEGLISRDQPTRHVSAMNTEQVNICLVPGPQHPGPQHPGPQHPGPPHPGSETTSNEPAPDLSINATWGGPSADQNTAPPPPDQLPANPAPTGTTSMTIRVSSTDGKAVKGALVIAYGCKPECSAAQTEVGRRVTGQNGTAVLKISEGGEQFPNFDIYVDAQGHELQDQVFKRADIAREIAFKVTAPSTQAIGKALQEPTPALVPEAARSDVYPLELMSELPVPGERSFDYFALLSPGVLPPPPLNNGPGPGLGPTIGSAGEVTVNGLRSRENSYAVDGTDDNDEEVGVRRQGFLFLAPETIDAISELKVTTAFADAQFGRNIAGELNANTRTGGASAHGTIYAFLTDRRFNARDFFDLKPDSLPAVIPLTRASDNAPVLVDGRPGFTDNPVTRDPPMTRFQGGLVFGGPLAILKGPAANSVKDPRTFFFISYERKETNASRQMNFAVPTVEQRGFAGLGAVGLPQSAGALYPSTVPGDAIFSLFPFPNNPAGPYGRNTYTEVLPASGAGEQLSLGIDREFQAWKLQHRAAVRYSISDENVDLPATGGALDSAMQPRTRPNTLSGFVNTSFRGNRGNTFRLSYSGADYQFKELRDPALLPSSPFPQEPFLLNAPLILNVSQNGVPQFVSASSFPSQWTNLVGSLFPNPQKLLQQNLTPETESITGPIGEVNVAGFSPIGADVYHFPQTRDNHTLQISDTFVQVRHRFTFTAGFELWYYVLNSDLDSNARPEVDFFGERVQGSPLPNASAAPLLLPTDMVATGIPEHLYQTLNSADAVDTLQFHRKQLDLFEQTEFRPARNLTVSLGARVELGRLPESSDPHFSQLFAASALSQDISNADQSCATMPNPSFCTLLVNSLERAFPPNFTSVFSQSLYGVDGRAGVAWSPFGNGRTMLRGGFGTYGGQLPEIVTSESRSLFPEFVPLDLANTPNGGFYLYNVANPNVCVVLNNSPGCTDPISPGTLNVLGQNSTDPVYVVARQLNRLSTLVPTLPAGGLKRPQSTQFGLTAEHRLANLVLSAAYVGTLGRHLLQVTDPDVPFTSQLTLGLAEIGSTGFPQFTANTDRPVGLPGVFRTLFESSASSKYNSLQLQARGRVKSWQFGAAFTWSHAEDDASDFFDTANTFALPQDGLHRSEWGDSAFDVRLRLVGYFLWAPKLGGRLLRDWQLSGVYTAQTGQPYTINSSIDVNQDGILTDRLATTNGLVPGKDRRVDWVLTVDPSQLLSPTEQSLSSSGTSCIDAAAMVNRCDGAVGRNTFRAGGLNIFDMALALTFQLGPAEANALQVRKALQVRIEAFNLLNQPQFGIPVRILEAPGFGAVPNTAAPNRVVQAAIRLSF